MEIVLKDVTYNYKSKKLLDKISIKVDIVNKSPFISKIDNKNIPPKKTDSIKLAILEEKSK